VSFLVMNHWNKSPPWPWRTRRSARSPRIACSRRGTFPPGRMPTA